MSIAICWNEEFETGIDIIDAQHRQIFDYLKEIDEAIASRSASAESIEHVLQCLIDYTLSHNTFEEGLMEQAGYPLLEAHCAVHERFRERALSYSARLSSGENPIHLAREVRGDIGLWLNHHIKRDDKHYVDYVKRSIDGSFVRRMLGKIFG